MAAVLLPHRFHPQILKPAQILSLASLERPGNSGIHSCSSEEPWSFSAEPQKSSLREMRLGNLEVTFEQSLKLIDRFWRKAN